MNKSFKSIISLVLCLSLIFGVFSNVRAEPIDNKDDIKMIANTSKMKKVKLERNGIEAVATLTNATKEIRLNTIEMQQDKKVEKSYKVKVKTAVDNTFVADFIDEETNQVYRVDSDKIRASFAFLIPIGIVVGEALIARLLAASLAIVIGEITYTVAKEIASNLNNKGYNYYLATLRYNNVYIGSPLTDAQARSELLRGGDTWAISEALARRLASSIGGLRGPERHGTSTNYYCHYHSNYASFGVGHSFYNSYSCPVKK